MGFTLNGVPYWFVKNLQGDVEKIYDDNGNCVAQYKYDAWGNHEIVSSIDGIAKLNAIRYRSYYFDMQTGLYYLQTRYYDPQVCRFLNMDGISILNETKHMINGLNLYAYCGNNPAMHIDPDGRLFFLIAGALIGGGIAAATGGNFWQGALNGALVGVSLTLVGAGAVLCATGAGAPLGAALISIGAGGLIAGGANAIFGGSFAEGWAGGTFSSLFYELAPGGPMMGFLVASAASVLIQFASTGSINLAEVLIAGGFGLIAGFFPPGWRGAVMGVGLGIAEVLANLVARELGWAYTITPRIPGR
jgi:RHS repeat-associated protein